jgi:hypothetical protein
MSGQELRTSPPDVERMLYLYKAALPIFIKSWATLLL